MTLPARHRVVHLLGPDALAVRECDLQPPGPGEVLLRVDVALTCGTDLKVLHRGGHPRMLQPPCPFGHEVAGTVAAVGAGAGPWREGDPVVVANSASCGTCAACRADRENLCHDLFYLNGAYGEWLHLPERFVRRSLHRRAPALAPEIAALAEPLACVLHGAETLDLAPERRVAILGAGPIGLLMTWVLAREGHRVTLVDPHAARLEVGARLGALRTVADRAVPGGPPEPRSQDVAIEATGRHPAWDAAVDSLHAGGVALLFGGLAPGERFAVDAGRLHYDEITVMGAYHHRPATFARALDLLADSGDVLKELIQGRVGLDGVHAALRAMERREALKVAVRP